MVAAALFGAIGGERVIDLVQGAEHGALEREGGLLLLRLAQFQGAAQPAVFEDRHGDRRAEGVGVGAPIGEVAELQPLDGATARQGDAREEIGPRHPDRRRHGVQIGFGVADVRPAAGEFAGDAHRHARRHWRQATRCCQGRQALTGRLAEQQRDGVDQPALLFLQARQLRLDGGELGRGIGDIEIGGQAAAGAFLGQPAVLPGDLQILPHDADLALHAAQSEVVARQFGRGGDQQVARRLLAGRHLGIGRLDRAGDAAPQVDLP